MLFIAFQMNFTRNIRIRHIKETFKRKRKEDMLVYLFKVIMDILYAFHIEQRFPINMHITFANRLVRKNIDQDLIILKLLL